MSTLAILDILALKRQAAEGAISRLRLKELQLISSLERLIQLSERTLNEGTEITIWAQANSKWQIWQKDQLKAQETELKRLRSEIEIYQGQLLPLLVQINKLNENVLRDKKKINLETTKQKSNKRINLWTIHNFN